MEENETVDLNSANQISAVEKDNEKEVDDENIKTNIPSEDKSELSKGEENAFVSDINNSNVDNVSDNDCTKVNSDGMEVTSEENNEAADTENSNLKTVDEPVENSVNELKTTSKILF
mgnify:FL=1